MASQRRAIGQSQAESQISDPGDEEVPIPERQQPRLAGLQALLIEKKKQFIDRPFPDVFLHRACEGVASTEAMTVGGADDDLGLRMTHRSDAFKEHSRVGEVLDDIGADDQIKCAISQRSGLIKIDRSELNMAFEITGDLDRTLQINTDDITAIRAYQSVELNPRPAPDIEHTRELILAYKSRCPEVDMMLVDDGRGDPLGVPIRLCAEIIMRFD